MRTSGGDGGGTGGETSSKAWVFPGLALGMLALACTALAQAPAPGGAPAAAGGAPPGLNTAAAAQASGAGGLPPGVAAAPAAPGAGGLPPGISGASAAPARAAPAAPAAASAPAQKTSEAWTAPAAVYEAVDRKPQPAFMVPLAGKRLMLDVTRAGHRLVAVGAHGVIVVSDDDGKSWTQVHSPVRELLTAVGFANDKDGWAVGHDAVILATTDGGESWHVQHFDPKAQAPLLGLHFLDAQRGWAFGAFGALLATADGGHTWTPVDADNIRLDQLNFYAAAQLGNGALLLAGERGLVDLSTDHGATWKKLTSPWNGSFFGVLPVGAKGALLFGLRGHVYISDDAASGQWRRVPTATTASFYGGAALPDGRFVLVGTAGMIMVLSPNGDAVQRIKGPASRDYDAVLPVAGRLILAGMSGMRQTGFAQ